jgi:hypothetical protein
MRASEDTIERAARRIAANYNKQDLPLHMLKASRHWGDALAALDEECSECFANREGRKQEETA